MSSSLNYDSELCGKVPIHFINTVQPYGVLLVLSRASLEIIQASENVDPVFGVSAKALVGSPIASWLDPISLDLLRTSDADKLSKVWTIRDRKYLALVHIKAGYILAEIEMTPYREEGQNSFVSVYQEIKYAMALIEDASTTADVCTIAARELRRISGFDKVMLYRFDRDWNGTVIAEECRQDMESYLGFTFPASDIPRQARELYLRNPYRFIPDRSYKAVKLFPVINPQTHAFIDLSDCNTRGVSSVHLEYLANMDVMASMSTRILDNDSLWGLIACHHKTPKQIDFQLCSIFELLSNFISVRISSLQNKEKHMADNRNRTIFSRLMEQVYASGDIRTGLFQGDVTLLELFTAHGAVIAQDGQLSMEGIVPDKENIEELLLWLHTCRITRPLHTERLSADFERAAAYMETGSGLLAIPFHPELEKYLLVFRPEVKKVIDWGGDPGARIVFEKDGLNYHPRHSFNAWRQIVDGTSLPWQDEELAVAENLRSFLYEYTSK
jgi:two-component system, chemotaxis family, sensor kinase Cph1